MLIVFIILLSLFPVILTGWCLQLLEFMTLIQRAHTHTHTHTINTHHHSHIYIYIYIYIYPIMLYCYYALCLNLYAYLTPHEWSTPFWYKAHTMYEVNFHPCGPLVVCSYSMCTHLHLTTHTICSTVKCVLIFSDYTYMCSHTVWSK